MAFNGSGTYVAPSSPGAFNPATSGGSADPTSWNTLLTDIQTALSTVICKDGQSTVTANIPMATFKITGLGAGTAATDAATLAQVQSAAASYVAAGGTANAITLTVSPAITSYALGSVFRFKTGAAANSGAVTLNISAIGAGTVVWPDSTALVASDLPANAGIEVMVVDITTPTAPIFHVQTATHLTKSPTQAAGDNTTLNATTAFVTAAITASVGKVYIQKFTGSGTYTPHAGMVNCIIECVGGGGGGGGIASAGANQFGGAAGGGAGGYSRLLATAATIGASKAVTIGALGAGGTAGNNAGSAGADTSVGVLCVGKGGSGGGGSDGVNGTISVGGAGGVAGTGDATIVGQSGQPATTLNLIQIMSGTGGAGVFGAGGSGKFVAASAASAGNAASGFGGGGGGGASSNGGGAVAGGAGTAGYVIITEFCNQ